MEFVKKLKEVFLAILPLVAIVGALDLILILRGGGLEGREIVNFLISSVLVILGEVVFLIGIDNSIVAMGEMVGSSMVKIKKIYLILAVGFIFGFLCTIAEPDLQVLSGLVNKILPPDSLANKAFVLLAFVGLGVAVFIALAMLKTLFKLSFKAVLLISYGILFAVVAFTPDAFLSLALDSGGVTTGPITVPFILALSIGVASVHKGSGRDDNFGMVALASVGPVIAVAVLGLLSGGEGAGLTELAYEAEPYGHVLVSTLSSVTVAILPIAVTFLIFNFLFIKLPRAKLLKIMLSVGVVFLGLILFLSGVDFGFSAAGKEIGKLITEEGLGWILIPMGVLIGVVTVFTEPAVEVLGEQVEKVTAGNIKKRTLKLSFAVAFGLAVAFGVMKALWAISIWWFVIPGYAICLALTFFSPEIFAAIGYDSGGVASGPMTAAFTLPLVVGVAEAAGESILMYAFGLVALVAMMPPIVIQILGVLFKLKESRHLKADLAAEKLLAAGKLAAFAAFAAGDIDYGNLKTEGV